MTQLVLTARGWTGFNGILNWIREVNREIKFRQDVKNTIRELEALSDYELRDIGINRGMIRSIAMEAYYDNQRSSVEANSNLKGWV